MRTTTQTQTSNLKKVHPELFEIIN